MAPYIQVNGIDSENDHTLNVAVVGGGLVCGYFV